MKKYKKLEFFVTRFNVIDVLTESNNGVYEGVSNLDPTSDWF